MLGVLGMLGTLAVLSGVLGACDGVDEGIETGFEEGPADEVLAGALGSVTMLGAVNWLPADKLPDEAADKFVTTELAAAVPTIEELCDMEDCASLLASESSSVANFASYKELCEVYPVGSEYEDAEPVE